MSRSLLDPTRTWLSTTTGAIVRALSLLEAGEFLRPSRLASARVERDQIVVGRHEEQVAVPHADATVPDVGAAACLPHVVPDLSAGAAVDRPGVVRRRHIQDAIDLEDRPLICVAPFQVMSPIPPSITGMPGALVPLVSRRVQASVRL